jgi:hypothetical protein
MRDSFTGNYRRVIMQAIKSQSIILAAALCLCGEAVFAQSNDDAAKELANAITDYWKAGDQSALFIGWDPFLHSTRVVFGERWIYPWHTEIGFTEYRVNGQNKSAVLLDVLQFIWESGDNHFGSRFGVSAPFIIAGNGDGCWILQGVAGIYAGGGEWFGVFIEARPGFAFHFGKNTDDALFSMPLCIAFAFVIG